jgi:hypothetical protein
MRVEEAGALSERIVQDIKRHEKTILSHMKGKTPSKDLWATVRRLTGRKREASAVDGVTAKSLNHHYSAISTDLNYVTPLRKQAASVTDSQYISVSLIHSTSQNGVFFRYLSTPPHSHGT